MERDFTKAKPEGYRPRVYDAWADIRSRSILEFVNVVSKTLGAPLDRGLREQLYAVVFSNGADPVQWRQATYTGPMLLTIWGRGMTEHR